MACVPATITVTFKTDYTGCHRVCYRLNNSGGYTCVDTTCLGGGTLCSVPIAIPCLDNESCPTVEFDGYAQACCEDVSSTDGRVYFSTPFVPSPSCKRYLATCNSVALASITVDNEGSGYTVGTNPTVMVAAPPSGVTALAHGVVGTGFILTTGITFTSNGSGYNGNVSQTFTEVPLLVISGSGSGGQGTFTVDNTGAVVLGTITAQGVGYNTGDTLKPDPAFMGGNTTDATFNVVADYGTVIEIILDNAGTGYTTAPLVTVVPPASGTTATATAVLGTCSAFVVTSCTGQGYPAGGSVGNPVSLLQPGKTVDFCTAGVPPAPSDYTIAQDTGNCLCNCQSTTLTSTEGDVEGKVTFRYTACNGAVTTVQLFSYGSPSSTTVCAVTGSVVRAESEGATGTVTFNGACY